MIRSQQSLQYSCSHEPRVPLPGGIPLDCPSRLRRKERMKPVDIEQSRLINVLRVQLRNTAHDRLAGHTLARLLLKHSEVELGDLG